MRDYLKWRGDLDFSQSEFCEVDNLILSCLSYVNFTDIVPDSADCISIADAAERFFAVHTQKELKKDQSLIREAPFLLRDMALTKRFRTLLLRHYKNLADIKKELQFSAVEILLGDGSSFISYCGTDDTLNGWKEDFNMSLGNVPAETAATDYLNQIGNFGYRPLRVGGHSKGGHLAIYAASLCMPEIQGRILDVYSNDGPGFLELFFDTPGYKKIQPRIHRYVPEFSIVGMLLHNTGTPVILQSSNRGIMQHSAFSWQIEGPSFIRGEKQSMLARTFTDSVRNWLCELDTAQRKVFIDDLFTLLQATGARTLSELQDSGIRGLTAMAKELDAIHPETREKFDALRKIFMSQWKDSMKDTKINLSR